MSKVKVTKRKDCPMTADELKVGQYAEITEKGDYHGHIILRVYDEIISVTDPGNTWHVGVNLEVEPLLPGDKIEIIV